MKTILFLLLTFQVLLIPLGTNAQTDFREETIYFLLTTRFFDGDPSNNVPNEWSSYHPNPTVNPEITDPNDVTWRGDFKGLIEKLDYIQDLGFTAIWITPIVQNWSPLDYHGYHAYDFTKVDPRLESPGATFQDLIDAVHARGMKIVLDVVTNHSGRFGIKDVAEIKYNTDPTQPWGQDSNGNVLQPNPNWEYDGLTPNPDDGKIWSRANLPTMPPPYNNDLASYNWPSTQSYVDTTDPDWYHHSGNGFAQGWDDTENLYNRALAGDTPDLNTGSQVVRDYLVAAYTTFINMGVDAFRWDTMKHMDKEDVLYFKDAFHAVNPDLFIFGEVAQKRHELHNVEEINPHWYTWRGQVNNSANSDIAVLDFYAEATFHGVFEEGGGFSGVQAAARYDHLYSDPSTLLTWLDNHDFGPNNDWNARYGGSEENLAACMNFMFTWRGIPVVYYGTEIQFMKGEYADIHDASGITKSIDQTGRAYYGDQFDQAPNHVIYQHIKKLNAIRKAVPALQKGSWRWDGNGGGNAVGYVRKHNDSEVAVGLAKDGSATFHFSGLTNGIYRDAVTGAEVQVNNGALSFDVTSGSAGIFVHNGPGMIGGNGVGYFQSGVGGANPVASISPSAGHYNNPVTVVLSSSSQHEPSTIYYTTDGSTPTINSPTYTGSFVIDTHSTVSALAVDSQGNHSGVTTHSYTIGEISGLTVYFKNNDGWNTPNIYYWGVQPTGAVGDVNWPGIPMQNDGDGWYKYTLANTASANLIFNDGNNQTDDLNRSADGWFENGVWSNTDPRTPVDLPPSVVIDVAGGNFTEGDQLSITISASDDSGVTPTIHYTLDGTAPTNQSQIYSGAIQLTATTTLRALAIDNASQSSSIASETYTFLPPAAGLAIYFKPDGYVDPEIYFWAVTPSGASTSWPGVTMNEEGDGWYSYTLENADCSNIIFSDNGNGQTPDLNRCGEGWYEDGIWYDQKPEPGSGLTVHFKKPSEWNTVNIHYWGVTPSSIPATQWPGPSMTSDGDDWYSFTIADASCANMVFNDNGNAQTEDLNRCSEGWYSSGWSTTSSRLRDLDQINEDSPANQVMIYPNPSTYGRVNIDLNLSARGNYTIQVLGISGRIIEETHLQSTIGSQSLSLETEHWPNGIYIVQVNLLNEVIKKRLTVMN